MSGREKYLFDLQGFLMAPLMEPFAGKRKSRRGGRYFSDTLPDTSTIPVVLTKPTYQSGFRELSEPQQAVLEPPHIYHLR